MSSIPYGLGQSSKRMPGIQKPETLELKSQRAQPPAETPASLMQRSFFQEKRFGSQLLYLFKAAVSQNEDLFYTKISLCLCLLPDLA